MHKTKIIAGIVIIVIGTTLLVIEIENGLRDNMNYYQCTHPPTTLPPTYRMSIPCHNFLDHVKPILVDIGILCAGILVLLFGLKSVSLRSLSKE